MVASLRRGPCRVCVFRSGTPHGAVVLAQHQSCAVATSPVGKAESHAVCIKSHKRHYCSGRVRPDPRCLAACPGHSHVVCAQLWHRNPVCVGAWGCGSRGRSMYCSYVGQSLHGGVISTESLRFSRLALQAYCPPRLGLQRRVSSRKCTKRPGHSACRHLLARCLGRLVATTALGLTL